MDPQPAVPADSNETSPGTDGRRPVLAGVEVRSEDFDPQRGLHIVSIVFRVCSGIILLLALWQFAAWWADRPPGGVGVGVLVGDTIRLIVVSFLLWGAGELAEMVIKTHYDVRAGRILLARQTYMIRQMAIASGALPPDPVAPIDRRGEGDIAVPPEE